MIPERLNLFDRFFNRYRREIVEQGSETWQKYSSSDYLRWNPIKYGRDFVIYKIIDRLTGSEKIEKEYLN